MSENPILKEMQYEASKGALSFKGVRYLLVRPETITGFQKAVREAFGPRAEERLFDGGFSGGLLSARKYREVYGFSAMETLEFMMSMGNQIGWGHFTLGECSLETKRLCVSVSNSPFAQAYGRSDHGVCHLIRGVIAGMATVLFEGECKAEETSCVAKGDRECLFEVEGKK